MAIADISTGEIKLYKINDFSVNINYKINKTILNLYSDILYRKYVKITFIIYYESVAVIFYKMKTKTIKHIFCRPTSIKEKPNGPLQI